MEVAYTNKQKLKLKKQIEQIKKKKDLVRIYEILQQDDVNITTNNNGMFMFFHDLDNKTYVELDKFLHKLNKQKFSDTGSITDDTYSEKKEYMPYAADEFPSQKGIGPKFKYSNREKNIIKRIQYNKNINSENGEDDDVEYCDFNASDSENKLKIKTESLDDINNDDDKNNS